MNNQQPLLHAHHIHKYFHTPSPLHILKDISLSVYPGQTVAIIGKSGEGKSTLLHILGTIEPPSSGTLYIQNEKIVGDTSSIRSRHIGFVFQSFHLLNDLTVFENVLLPMKIARKNTKKGSPAEQRALELIERISLTHRINIPCSKLSGGEKQRVAIARALANNPTLILADEPTGNLDHATALEIQTLLFACAREEQKALVIVTHNRELAAVCDTIYKLEDGKLYPDNV